jgi:hypothetical protein
MTTATSQLLDERLASVGIRSEIRGRALLAALAATKDPADKHNSDQDGRHTARIRDRARLGVA